MALLRTILTLELAAIGFAVPHFAAVAALGVRAVRTHMAVLVAANAFDMRAVFPRVALLHHPTVSARFGVRPKNHLDDKTTSYLGEQKSCKVGPGR